MVATYNFGSVYVYDIYDCTLAARFKKIQHTFITLLKCAYAIQSKIYTVYMSVLFLKVCS